MTRLVKNELIKIFHKKGIYILSGILVVIMLLSLAISKVDLGTILEGNFNDIYYESLKNTLETYDLNDKDEVLWYIGDKVELDIYNLTKDLEYSSYEYYYIDSEVRDLLTNMYNAKYLNKNEAEYEAIKATYEKTINNLDSYDWKAIVKENREELLNEREELNGQLVSASDDEKEEIQDAIEYLGYQIKALDYRLNNDVAPAYSESSYMVDEYLSAALSYSSLNKDESVYKDRSELIQKREIIKTYHEAAYKIENNIVSNSDYTLQDEAISIFSQTDMFVLIAFLIIAGGIIAEEFNKGTIKQLLLRPFSRSKILTSKIIAAVIATFIFACFYNFMDLLVVGLMNNEFSSLFDPIIVYNFRTESIAEYSTFAYCFIKFLAILPEYLLLFAVCILVGILTTNTVACVVSVFGVTFLQGLLGTFLPEKIMAFMPTNCMDFSQYLFGGISYNKYQTLFSSSIIYIITLGIVLVLSYMVFKKKDIKNQ